VEVEEKAENNKPDNESGKPVFVCVSQLQTSNAVNVHMKCFKQSGYATASNMHPLLLIKHNMDCMHFCCQKQTTISFLSLQY